MNEKIAMMAEQAGITYKQSMGVFQFFESEMERFVELLVRDCVFAVAPTSLDAAAMLAKQWAIRIEE